MRGDIPMPEGRPYSLGTTAMDVASVGATTEISASRSTRPGRRQLTQNAHAVSYEAAADRAPAASEPAGYAPPRSDEIGNLLSARGLY